MHASTRGRNILCATLREKTVGFSCGARLSSFISVAILGTSDGKLQHQPLHGDPHRARTS